MCVTQCIDLVNALDPERSRTPALAFVTTIPFSRSDGPGIREVPKGGTLLPGPTHLSPHREMSVSIAGPVDDQRLPASNGAL